MKIKIKIYTGLSVESKCGKQVHPLTNVKIAEALIKSAKSLDLLIHSPISVWSNSPDFISSIKYLALKEEIEIEFYLDGVNHGTDIEPIFESFNESIDYLDKIIDKI